MSNIILVGMMGSGKSTIAKRLESLLTYDIFDMDHEIEKANHLSIPQIFDQYGQEYFRDLEHKMCQSLDLDKTLISTGGGVVLNDANVSALKKLGTIIYLKANVEVLFNRLQDETGHRPLLDQKALLKQLEDLMENRKDLYEAAADVIVDINHISLEDLGQEIIKNLKEIGYKF